VAPDIPTTVVVCGDSNESVLVSESATESVAIDSRAAVFQRFPARSPACDSIFGKTETGRARPLPKPSMRAARAIGAIDPTGAFEPHLPFAVWFGTLIAMPA
jgi:hypothetical protein